MGVVAILPVSTELDLPVEALARRRIGTYAAAVGPDAATRPDASCHPIRAVQAITGFDCKPAPALQLYSYFGLEGHERTSFTDSRVGHGSPAMNLADCVADAGFPGPGGNRSIWQIMPGIWYGSVQGDHGSVAFGLSYIHTRRALWSGSESWRLQGREDSFVTSIRYYLR